MLVPAPSAQISVLLYQAPRRHEINPPATQENTVDPRVFLKNPKPIKGASLGGGGGKHNTKAARLPSTYLGEAPPRYCEHPKP